MLFWKFYLHVEIHQVPEFEEAAFSAPLNKVVRCKTKFGWHLLQVLSERYDLRCQRNMLLQEVSMYFLDLFPFLYTERNRFLNTFNLPSSTRKCKTHLSSKRHNWLMSENLMKCTCIILHPAALKLPRITKRNLWWKTIIKDYNNWYISNRYWCMLDLLDGKKERSFNFII